jgi:selenocysteine-specific elongation factor
LRSAAASGRLVPLGEGLYLHADVAEAGIATVRRLLKENGSLTVGGFRDAMGASRRTAVPFLEWCDTRRLTRRSGDVRLPGPNL